MSLPSLELKFGDLGRARPAPPGYFANLHKATRAELLTEAVRFFDLRSRGDQGIVKHDWPPLTFDILDRDLRTLRHDFNQALQMSMHSLYAKGPVEFVRYYNDAEQNFYLPYKQESFTYHDNANKARYVVRIFISDLFRTERFVEARKPKRGYFQGIKIDQIPAKLSDLRAALDAVLRDEALFALPVEMVVQLHDEKTTVGGLSEHLYVHAAVTPRQEKPKDIPPSIRRVHEAIFSIETALAGLNQLKGGFTANSQFEAWVRAIDELDSEFGRLHEGQASRFGLQWALVLTTLLRAYLAELKLRVLVTSLPVVNFYAEHLLNSYVGVCLWEALSGKPLKTPSVPNLLDIDVPTDNRYRLKFPGQHGAQDERDGFLRRENAQQGALLGSLAALLHIARQSVIGTGENAPPEGAGDRPSNIAEDIDGLLARFLQRPLIKASFAPEQKPAKSTTRRRRPPGPLDRYVFEDLSLDSFEKEAINRNPAMLRGPSQDIRKDRPGRPNYYAITEVLPSNPVSILNFGNTFSTQLCFYVACHLLRKVSRHFSLDGFYQQQREKADPSTIRNLQRELASLDTTKEEQYKLFVSKRLALQRNIEAPRFNFTAGSYLQGGSFPPHKTHRDGRHFDISMGPDLTPWRTTGLRRLLQQAWDHLRNYPTADSRLPYQEGRPRSDNPIYLCERSAADVGKGGLFLLDHQFLRRLVDDVTDKVVAAEVESVEEGCYDTAADAIGRQIQRLHGTPYFLEPDDAELAHVGTLCLVLSGPTMIIYAAPILVLRCYRSLLRAVPQLRGHPLRLDDVGVVDTTQLDQMIRSLLRCIDIAFLPSDHYHHWHLYYPGSPSPDSAATDKQRACRELERIEARLDLLAPLWLLLDVDLRPYERYLRQYKGGHLAYPDLAESRQLDEMIAFCETYARQREQRRAREGADEVSREFLHRAFLPHIFHVPTEFAADPCFGRELDRSANQPMAQELIKRSTAIKAQIEAYRRELLNLHGRRNDRDAKRLADQIAAYADVDQAHDEAEGGLAGPRDERDVDYERWNYTSEAWL